MFPDEPDKVSKAVALYRDRFTSIGMYQNVVYPGVPAALAALHGLGARLFVATSKVTRFAERIIEHFQLADHIRCVHGSELDGTRGNKAELISHILQVESLPATQTCMVGDREHDMVGARVNAVCGIGALWGYGSRRELLAAGASFVCEEPSRLARLLSTVPLK